MKYVYLIKSKKFPDQRYIGLADDVEERLKAHNSGKSKHTSKYRPWQLESYIAFRNSKKAIEFEKYLKTVSGLAFSNKRLW